MENALAIMPSQTEWSQIKEVASMAVKSGLLPASIKTPEAAAIIALKGRELGLPPMVAFAHIVVIAGKPTMSAEIMLAYIYKDHPSAEIEIVERSETKCVIKAKRPMEKTFSTFTWDLERAKKMGLIEKDNWKKQPGTMMFWRCITEMKRAKFPEVLMGIDYAPEELGANIDEKGELKDVTPRAQQPNEQTQPVEVQTISKVKNYAPQTQKEAIERMKENAVNEKPPVVSPSRAELSKEINSHVKRLGKSGAEVVEFCKVTFSKRPDELNEDEMAFLVDSLASMEVPA